VRLMRYVLPRRRTTCVPALALSDLREFLTFMSAPYEARFPLAVFAELHDLHDLLVVFVEYQPIATTLTAGPFNRAAVALIPR
jgi:hypothetical protein